MKTKEEKRTKMDQLNIRRRKIINKKIYKIRKTEKNNNEAKK